MGGYTGTLFRDFFAFEYEWKETTADTIGVGVEEPSTGEDGWHHPFNPIIRISFPKPEYKIVEERTGDSLVPNIIYTESLEPDEVEIECIFKDPWLLLALFGNKTVEASWDGDALDAISADFTVLTDADTIKIHYHIDDPLTTNDIDKTLFGGIITGYRLIIEAGKLVKEFIKIKVADFKEEVQAMVCADAFHDIKWGTGVGGWADWDSEAPFHSSVCDVKTGAAGATAISGMTWKKTEFIIEIPEAMEQTGESLIVSQHYTESRNWRCEVSGVITTDAMLTEYENTVEARDRDDILKVYIGATTTKFLQMTNIYLAGHTKVPTELVAGKPIEVTLNYKGGVTLAGLVSALTYQWKGTAIAQSPDIMITD